MTVTNYSVGQTINLTNVLNSKLEKPILQTEMGLDIQATGTKQAVRWDEFSARHNNVGTIKQQMFNKSGNANPSATVNNYGVAITNIPPTNYTSVLTLGANIVFGGTFGSSETVTLQKTVTYSDGTSTSITKTATASGTVTLSVSDFLTLVKDGVYITQTSYQSQSNIANSQVTVSVNRYGMYL